MNRAALRSQVRAVVRKLRDAREHVIPGARGVFRIAGPIGKEPEGVSASVLLVGRERLVPDANTTFFRGFGVPRPVAGGAAADITLTDPPFWRRRGPSDFLLPAWVEGLVRPGPDFAEYRRHQVSPHLRWKLNKADRERYTIAVGSGEADLRMFYDAFLVPTATLRHAQNAHIPPFETFAGQRDLELIFLVKDGRRVGGTALVRSRHESFLHVWRNGLAADILADPRRMNLAHVAMLSHVMRRACEQGIERVSLGYTTPVLDDGLVFYKSTWGCTFEPLPSVPRFSVELNTLQAYRLLAARPLMEVRGDTLHGRMAFFADGPESPAQLVDRMGEYALRGLATVRVYLFGDPATVDAILALPASSFAVPLEFDCRPGLRWCDPRGAPTSGDPVVPGAGAGPGREGLPSPA